MANEVSTVKRIKGWQIALFGILAIALVIVALKMFGKDGFLRHTFDRTADGLGWLLDQGAEATKWIGGGIESGIEGVSDWWEETDFQQWDWTFWD